jgi:hypothetical protein
MRESDLTTSHTHELTTARPRGLPR